MAGETVDGCDNGDDPNDIKTIKAFFDDGTGEITVEMILCSDPSQPNNKTKYRVRFDHTAPFFDEADRNGDQVVDANDICFNTADDTMAFGRKKATNKIMGPGLVDVNAKPLTFRVAVNDLGLTLGYTVFIWAETQLKSIKDRAPNTVSDDGCSKPEADAEVVALTLEVPTCIVANGLTWCYNAGACGEPCNDVCAAKGMVPIGDNFVWFHAQNTLAECQAISEAFGLGSNVTLGNFVSACVVDTATRGRHTVGGSLISPLFCSTDSNCPGRLRTNMDQIGNACGPLSTLPARRAICPCV